MLATLTFACMHFSTFLADFVEFCSVAALFDGQKSTRSRVHFKLNLFAGAKWSAKAGRDGKREREGKHSKQAHRGERSQAARLGDSLL